MQPAAERAHELVERALLGQRERGLECGGWVGRVAPRDVDRQRPELGTRQRRRAAPFIDRRKGGQDLVRAKSAAAERSRKREQLGAPPPARDALLNGRRGA